jgi:lipopolysaccharide biosynthesis glycosyltransferase/glycosyltransferase involved in cell wall biosynthesis
MSGPPVNRAPLVTVVIPAFNAARWIERTLASVAGQTMADFEAIVVDDGSQDNTADLVTAFSAKDQRFRLLQQPNSGVSAARNAGAAQARGGFIALLDADDLWAPENLAEQLARLRAAPDSPFCYARSCLIDENDIVLAPPDAGPAPPCTFEALLLQNAIGNGSACVVRRSAFQAVGGFDPSFKQGGEDWLFTLKLAALGPFTCAPAPLVGYRQSANGFSTAKVEQSCENILRVLDEVRRTTPGLSRQTFLDARSNALAWYLRRLLRAGRLPSLLRFAGMVYLANPLALRLPLPLEVASKGLIRQRQVRSVDRVGQTFPLDVGASPKAEASATPRPMAAESSPVPTELFLAFGVDTPFVPHLAATIASVAAGVGDTRATLLIIHDGVPAVEQARVELAWPQASFLWRRMSEADVEGLSGREHISRATFYRLAIPALAPSHVERCLYLDSDLIVVDDIRELWRTDLEGAPIGAVIDTGMAWRGFATEQGLDPAKGPYFNAGVLLLDLAQIRREHSFETARALAARTAFLYLDQDALNITFWGRWKKIAPRWNLQHTVLMQEVPADIAPQELPGPGKPALVHYTSKRKPWLKDEYHPYAWLYWRALHRTPFAKDVAQTQQIPLTQQLRLFLRWLKHWPHFGGKA